MYDVIILGGGPAGLSAGIYAVRAGLKTLVIEKAVAGGQISGSLDVDNYPGLPNISGFDLGKKFKDQAVELGCEFVNDEVIQVSLKGEKKLIEGKDKTYESKTVILATGAKPRPLGAPGEEKFMGKGISYCATCDAPFYEGFDIYIVGGGNTAVEEALYLSKFAKKIYIIHRRDRLRASKSLQDMISKMDKVHYIWDSKIVEIKGDKIVNEIVIENIKTGKLTKVNSKDQPFGLFVFIGFNPETEIFKDQVEMKDGFIITNEDMKTNLDGVFAAGDLRLKEVKQVITAASDGAIAAINANLYIEKQRGTLYEGFKK